MKILLVHEYYRSSSPSGEDKVFERELELLERKSLNVETLIFKNDDIGTPNGPSVLQTALSTPWSSLGKVLVKEAIESFRPDLVHFHNTFPVISQSAIYQTRKLGLATVQTLHNYRSICAQAMLMRDGEICEMCLNRYPWPALLYKCYRNSIHATVPLVANIALNRFMKTLPTKVDRIIVLSEFSKKKFVEAGFPGNKIRIKPNFFYENNTQKPYSERERRNNWIFIGRLKEEKGVQLLIPVWRKIGDKAPMLHIVGDGPLFEKLKAEIKHHKLEEKIILHGLCTPPKVNELLGKASLLVFPSIWYEGFPLVIGEAYVTGVPVACSKIGTLQYLVQDKETGIHFQPGHIDDMASKLSSLVDNPDALIMMGKNARKEYEKKYTPGKNFQLIMDIYREAIDEKSKIMDI